MASSSGQRLSADATAYLIHHVVFPPKLPQRDDYNASHELCLLQTTISALRILQSEVEDCDGKAAVASGITAIESLRDSRDCHGNVSEHQLLQAFQLLLSTSTDDTLPLEIKAQNAGLLVSRCGHDVFFEAFELSPVNNAVVSSVGRLVRTFPGASSMIPTKVMNDEAFQRSLAYTIAKMTTQAAPSTQPQVQKDGEMVNEDRDTTHPKMVTEFLLNTIAAHGGMASTVRISKHTRDDTLWSNCKYPWRRSPLWLLTRVTLQLLFARRGCARRSLHGLYKAFVTQFLSLILNAAKENWANIGSEPLYGIYAKIAHRFRKLEELGQLDLLRTQWRHTISNGMCHAYNLISKNWMSLSKNLDSNADIAALRFLQPTHDVEIGLPKLDDFIAAVSARKSNTVITSFAPSEEYPSFPADVLPKALGASGGHQFFRLAAFETWVEQHLPSWFSTHIQNHETCGHLRIIIRHYHSVASTLYADLPCRLSIMHLTLLELWVACDKSACEIYRLLRDYSPEVSVDECQCLILPFKSQMKRLLVVEKYVQSRNEKSIRTNPSVFCKFGSPSSFAVRFFDQSSELHDRLREIERNAVEEKKWKLEELADLKRRYKSLMDSYNSRSCETHEVVVNKYHGYTETKHKPNCSRCALKARADTLDIHIHEWPVSSNKSIAKATVFELLIPEAFSDWRDASMYLIADVLGYKNTSPVSPQNRYTLDKHHGLTHMLSSTYHNRRIIPLSSVKPHTGTHRKYKAAIPNLQEEDVCVANALQYSYFDNTLGVYTGLYSSQEAVAKSCMHKMPNTQSKALERFLYRPPSAPDGLPPNEVIATVSDCPESISIEEYKAFCTLSLGRNILYLNILTQLAAPSIDFSKVETQSLVRQVIGQAGVKGTDDDPSRVSHRILQEKNFGYAILEQLKISLSHVTENWDSWRAAASFIALALRILSLTLSPDVQERCLQFLDQARNVGMKWLTRLKCSANISTDEKQRSELYSRAVEVALMCVTTFDVEANFIPVVLQAESAISILLRCSITVQENQEFVKSDSQDLYKAMLQSWRFLMYRVFPSLRHRLMRKSKALNDAVLANWAAFRPLPVRGWSILSDAYQHWLCAKSGSLPVHFNLLTGELLVNGVPLARLPSDYLKHPVYTPLFGKSIIEVVPSDKAGLTFSANSAYRAHELHFGMEGSDMYVLALKEHCSLDLLPSRLFDDELPFAFVRDYIHWYDHSTNEVLFRPRTDPWSRRNGGWRLVRNGPAWCFVNGVNVLTNMTRPTARTISKILSPLEDEKHIHIILNTTTQNISIALPRLQLDFFLQNGESNLQSHQYRDMIVDADQTIGTLVGLRSKLVLKPSNQGQPRLVLIPSPRTFGPDAVMYQRAVDQSHVWVSVNKDQSNGVYSYSLDTILGRVLNAGDMQRKLYLAFLHALTSHCLPDPLTGYTGTESALSILRSAALHSFEFLATNNIDALCQIGALSPRRSFYPPDLMEMQQIKWNTNLPALSQDPQLGDYVEAILNHAKRMRLLFSDGVPDLPVWEPSNRHLEARAAIRSSTFRVCGYGGEHFTSKQDTTYSSRDANMDSEMGQRAYIATTLIMRDEIALDKRVTSLKETLLENHFRNADIDGSSAYFDPTTLRFDSKWLANSSDLLRKNWCHLHQTLPNSIGTCNRFDIATWLSTMAFAASADMDTIQTLAAFCRQQISDTIQPPSALIFNLAEGDFWNTTDIRAIARAHLSSFGESAEARLPKNDYETTREHQNRIQDLFLSRQDAAVDDYASSLQQQWPSALPIRPTSVNVEPYINTFAAMPTVLSKFQSWHRNRRFMEYLRQLSVSMENQSAVPISIPAHARAAPLRQNVLEDSFRCFSIENIFTVVPPSVSSDNAVKGSPTVLSPPNEPEFPILDDRTLTNKDLTGLRLEDLFGSLQKLAKTKCEKDYVSELRTSCASLKTVQNQRFHAYDPSTGDVIQELLRNYLGACKQFFDQLGDALARAARNNSSMCDRMGLHTQHSPRISPTFWLSQLHCDRFGQLPEAWKTAIIEYGLAVTHLHRAQRLLVVSNKPTDFLEELGHAGHSNWQPKDFPETLLLEAESGILIRAEQELIASHMRDPKGAWNIVLQLLMGGGKSSTIVPILAAYLSDKEKLVRIVVAKPQSKQMLQMLVAKLGGLLNRRIYHMPFSRALRPSTSDASLIRKISEECIAERGILLIQPEHILSFKLMAEESALAGKDVAPLLLDIQKFYDDVSRDIIDESDENFSVKFELIYTMGTQQPIELAPDRWKLIQTIVGEIPRFAAQVKSELPDSIEVRGRDDGKFSRIRILRSDAADQLCALVAKNLIEFGIDGLPTSSQSPKLQAALLQYVTKAEPPTDVVREVESSGFWTEATRSPLLLVRGLIAGGILRFALSTKRWRVNFGIDPSQTPRTPLAVPFRSKDNPSSRSEFSHPDVVILLTLLSYYYGGLTDDQLFDSFTHLQKSDQASIQYKAWVDTASSHLPAAFQQLSGVSTKDRHQCLHEIFPNMRYSKNAIDYYLSFAVFPKVMKEFPQKLSASGWDLGAVKRNPLTGFSGTNDTLHLLPLTVEHLDLPSQTYTNALVLQYLLQDENTVELLPPQSGKTDAEHLLSTIVKLEPEVRVIIDCGALILEQDNRQVAEAWLRKREDVVQAVVFFEDEELSVLDREGRIESLQVSPFAAQLGVCLVYLDEAHTRGTDLKLPRHYRAGVTLGQALTKDKLTQGCMRMRKLGCGQSVVFIVPKEILIKIRERTCKPSHTSIEVKDVLCWSIGETWRDLKQSMPLWAVQGERYERTQDILCGSKTSLESVQGFLEDEAQTLEVRYKPRPCKSDARLLEGWDMTNPNISKIVKRCQEFEAMSFGAATLSEEQERELAPEMEEEKQIERPPRLDAAPHEVHPDLQHLVRTGVLLNNPHAVEPGFYALASTSAGKLSPLPHFPNDLLVTVDFMRTVEIPTSSSSSFVSDSYQRPIQFVLSVPFSSDPKAMRRRLILISPFEANQLILTVRMKAKVTLHLFAPRINATFASLDRLAIYNCGLNFSADQVSRSLTMQLNLFAGSLYLRGFEEYKEICDFLGLLQCKPRGDQRVQPDGFIMPPVSKWGLTTSPVPFLRILILKIRREGQGIEKTHLGKILNGLRLEKVDFEEGI